MADLSPGGPPTQRGNTILVPEAKHPPGSRFGTATTREQDRGVLLPPFNGLGPLKWDTDVNLSQDATVIIASRLDLDLERLAHITVTVADEVVADSPPGWVWLEVEEADRKLVETMNDVRSRIGLPRLQRNHNDPLGPIKPVRPVTGSDRRLSESILKGWGRSDMVMASYLAYTSSLISKETTIKLISDV